ncbi:hypothetical protein [Tautonia plasticadhaerens]|uniref:Uncharacterized protein n=1 Tax=Tautonia plasticadhaerens TaxID=2527974 RepID=A0A518H0P2_9BACT|nr:hypothetical protein [Tautonia plasticadhaerens]QDV34414.1 hypothetical protein ElP_23000 [Tautonia plasticadhaerens]
MPWKRRGGRSYFYESRREGRRVRSVYVGSGWRAELVTDRLAEHREARQADRRHHRARRASEATKERAFDDLFTLSRDMAEWALRSAGFHRPNRGPWRRRRRPMSETIPEPARPTPPPVEPLELRRMMERAMLDRVVSATGENESEEARQTARTLKADLLAFAGELAGPEPTPLVRSLAFTAAVAYLDWMHAGFSERESIQRERAIERAERRFQRAAKTLHAVQRHRPESFMAVQINVGTGAGETPMASGPCVPAG